ncbi:hypothetical protein H8356DRAFT_601272 [Neocallimastix lanati (nom. inval.)]|jgi:hypothetical protein|uniref:Protein phosphatase 1 regulatory subunit 21 N-terminal domain-containing protein n=1 Tax=Neocallimastix californiae TaxID=1754190 RepID=A0A1Y2AYS1_9FUNG|nr:hypothetical protein H8356DRAFT_601272 [Neocallimastix sp. JGI-2020a]ORY27718.1 hypothetical protein LY90DRAFT_705863 [Neocallimastix californiae]|eukprot:ORY27718.1 hypothetical protein LY90DRAFT_705863 [Neocallimastix californiae]
MESLHAQKYQKLINEYTKTKAQLTIVKNALLEEQELTTQLKNENKMLILEAKKTEQQNELLFSHNQRLSKRIEILQNDSKNNNKKIKNTQYETIEVMSQELERKVLENADLYEECQNLKQEKEALENNLIAIIKQNNTLKESVSFEQLQIEHLIDEQNKTNEKVKTDEDFEQISEYKIMKSNLIMSLTHNLMIQKWFSSEKKKNWSFSSFHKESQKYLTKLLILLNNLYSKICNEIDLEKTNPIYLEYQEFDKTISINHQQENFTKANFYQFNTLSIIYTKTCQFINENITDFPKKEFEKICNSMKEFLDILIDTMEYEEKYKKDSKWRIISMSVIVLSSLFKELYDLYKIKNSYSEIIDIQKNIAKYALLMVEPSCSDFSSQKLSSLYTTSLSEVDKLINDNNITVEKNDILQKKLDEANEIIKAIPPPKEYREMETSTDDLLPKLVNKQVQVERLITFKDSETQTNEKLVLESLIRSPLESHINYLNKKLQTADSTVERLYNRYLNQQKIINQYKEELEQKESELKNIQQQLQDQLSKPTTPITTTVSTRNDTNQNNIEEASLLKEAVCQDSTNINKNDNNNIVDNNNYEDNSIKNSKRDNSDNTLNQNESKNDQENNVDNVEKSQESTSNSNDLSNKSKEESSNINNNEDSNNNPNDNSNNESSNNNSDNSIENTVDNTEELKDDVSNSNNLSNNLERETNSNISNNNENLNNNSNDDNNNENSNNNSNDINNNENSNSNSNDDNNNENSNNNENIVEKEKEKEKEVTNDQNQSQEQTEENKIEQENTDTMNEENK